MPRNLIAFALLSIAASAISLSLIDVGSAQAVWSGLTFSFTKANGTDPLLPENQDRLTNNVWITRNDFGMGLLNAKTECNELDGCTYTHNFSPEDTEWATAKMSANSDETIAATNHEQLAFDTWEAAYGFTVGQNILNPDYRDAVVHLITDDIFLDLQFTAWTQQGGGGFSYQRATAFSPPSPTGDYNHNGVVDAADYVVWRDTLGQAAAPPGSGADGNANGTIDAGDYTFWRSSFGNAVPGSAAGNNIPGAVRVPEPAAATILIGSWPLALGWRAKMGAVRRTRLRQEKGLKS